MSNEMISTLVPSTNRGRYALCALDDLEHGEYGDDLTSGELIAILLGGQWIEGRIEHSTHYDGPGCYHIADYGKTHQLAPEVVAADPIGHALRQPHDLFCGYYFVAQDGNVCGLCMGMQVRVR